MNEKKIVYLLSNLSDFIFMKKILFFALMLLFPLGGAAQKKLTFEIKDGDIAIEFDGTVTESEGKYVVDLNVVLKKSASYDAICRAVKKASETYLHGVIEYVDDEVVSGDFVGDPHTSIFDAREGIQLTNKFFKFLAFYDNEYGYSKKVLELIQHMYSVDHA